MERSDADVSSQATWLTTTGPKASDPPSVEIDAAKWFQRAVAAATSPSVVAR